MAVIATFSHFLFVEIEPACALSRGCVAGRHSYIITQPQLKLKRDCRGLSHSPAGATIKHASLEGRLCKTSHRNSFTHYCANANASIRREKLRCCSLRSRASHCPSKCLDQIHQTHAEVASHPDHHQPSTASPRSLPCHPPARQNPHLRPGACSRFSHMVRVLLHPQPS